VAALIIKALIRGVVMGWLVSIPTTWLGGERASGALGRWKEVVGEETGGLGSVEDD